MLRVWQDGTRPTVDSFLAYLPFFLQDVPTQECPKGGHAAYANAVNLLDVENRTVSDKTSCFYIFKRSVFLTILLFK